MFFFKHEKVFFAALCLCGESKLPVVNQRHAGDKTRAKPII